MSQWIYGLPTEEQLAINESRLWLQKTDNWLSNIICKLLPKEERRVHGGTRYYVRGKKLCEINEIVSYVDINEFWNFTIDSLDRSAVLCGDIYWKDNVAHILLTDSLHREEKFSTEDQKILLEHLTTMIFVESQQGAFKITLEEMRAFNTHCQYCPIDKDGNKIALGENYFTPFSHSLPPNYQWLPKGAFHFKHDEPLATFNTNTGEFGICYVVNGVEPEFVWKYNKPTSKPTHFANIENKIIL